MDKGDQWGVSSGGGMVNITLYNSSNCWVVVSGLNHNKQITYTRHQSPTNCCRSLNWVILGVWQKVVRAKGRLKGLDGWYVPHTCCGLEQGGHNDGQVSSWLTWTCEFQWCWALWTDRDLAISMGMRCTLVCSLLTCGHPDQPIVQFHHVSGHNKCGWRRGLGPS